MKIDFRTEIPKMVLRSSLKQGDVYSFSSPFERQRGMGSVWLAGPLVPTTGSFRDFDVTTGFDSFTAPDAMVFKLEGTLTVSYSRG